MRTVSEIAAGEVPGGPQNIHQHQQVKLPCATVLVKCVFRLLNLLCRLMQAEESE